MPFRMGGPEIVILLVIVMMIFGVGKLPQVGGAIGKAIREFRNAETGDLGSEPDSPPGSSSDRRDQT